MAKKQLKRLTIDEAVAEGFGSDAAPSAAASEGQAKACPTFVLRADRAGHVRALRAAIEELGAPDSVEARVALEAFKEYERR
jgi:hypothetical protein